MTEAQPFTPEFRAWPKTTRLFRNIVITEKIDGTNAAIHISPDGNVAAQSRNRLITPESDNYGFAGWVARNADDLAHILGSGLHFGEWWGAGIQRRYELSGRRFSLFNTDRWFKTGSDDLDSMATRAGMTALYDQIDAVPVLYQGTFSEDAVTNALNDLGEYGSVAAPGFMDPEGICVYHTQTKGVFKVTRDNHDKGKWEAEAA